jgi:uncharacterized protein (TIGR03118 family)
MKVSHRVAGIGGIVAAVCVVPSSFAAVEQVNLISDVAGLAQLTDPNLKNPWGISFSGASPFWISNQGNNSTELFHITNGQVIQNTATGGAATISIPQTAAGPQGPTGQVFNAAGTTAFVLNGTAASANFIFANLNGTISAWSGAVSGAAASVQATTPGAVYTGLALTGTGAGARLLAANSAAGTIDVFNSSFQLQPASGAFSVAGVAGFAGLVPFNVTTIGSSVYVTYALPGRPAEIAATGGQGAVAVFNTSGTLLQTIVDGHLASPWGVALAPTSFGAFGGDLLVGNFSFALSEINAFNPVTGAFDGSLFVSSPFASNGIWALEFGNGTSAPSNALLFAVGINGEADGLVGIFLTPEPASIALVGLGGLAMLLGARRRRNED